MTFWCIMSCVGSVLNDSEHKGLSHAYPAQDKALNSNIFYELIVTFNLDSYYCLKHIGMINRYHTYVFDLHNTRPITPIIIHAAFTCATRASDKKFIIFSRIVF